MRTCIIHAGLPKTGTTSIQSSLFHGLRDPRFRLLTLDSYFGNRTIIAAFSDAFGTTAGYYGRGTTRRGGARLTQRSRDYLDRALRAAERRGITPVISSEAVGVSRDAPPDRLRDFLVARGWQPRVLVYARAPLDLVESQYQQSFKTKGPRVLLSERIAFIEKNQYHLAIERLDLAFGREAVEVHWFDPASFPDRCVVRHFCASAGIPFRSEDVVRENDSINLAAIRFMYALLVRDGGLPAQFARDAWWRVLLERLSECPGPPLRLHASLTERYLESARQGWSALEDRIGRALPFSLHRRDPEGGVRCEADMLDFSAESLDWLARATGRRVVRQGEGDATTRGVVEQLTLLTPLRSLGTVRRLAIGFARERSRRAWLKYRNVR